MRPRVFVSQPIPEPALEILREVADVSVFPRLDRNMSEDEWIMAAKRSDYLFVMGGNIITASIIKADPELKGIALVHRRLPAGNSIDLETAKATGVAVLSQHPWEPVYDRIAEATCDLTIAMLLGLAYRLLDADRYTLWQVQAGAYDGADGPRVHGQDRWHNWARHRGAEDGPASPCAQNERALHEANACEEFYKMDNVILAPHNGGATWDARGELTKATARQIVTLIAGEHPEGLV